ncbi:NACHT domain-containing protein [Baekduia sp. Peel2402]|uniref:NACHT domain-containing protein n=1 Tax=Baekduia sp. Peel2402 TaxID=3458296 RepID=UPI00403EDED7
MLKWLRDRLFRPAMLAALIAAPVVAWLVVHDYGWKTSEKIAALGAAGALTATVVTFLERWVDRQGKGDDEEHAPWLEAERLDHWVGWLRATIRAARVGEGSQLDHMLGRTAALDAEARDGKVEFERERPLLKVNGRLLPWARITAEWDRSPGRLVVLGEPGYGKTVAALALVGHVGADPAPDVRVAELFSLAEWHRWRVDHRDETLTDWMAWTLSRTYAPLPAAVAHQLLSAGRIVPVLDGLDEVPSTDARRACVQAINAYALRTDPHRPFVVTCRSREYVDLAPEWVETDRQIVLAGFQGDQLETIIRSRTEGIPGWDAIRRRLADGDEALAQVFESPLLLSIALQAYRYEDPRELISLDGEEIERTIWDQLLLVNQEPFDGAGPTEIRTWLTFVATGMRSAGLQRFMLHDLYLLDPAPRVRRFSILIASATLFMGAALALLPVVVLAAPPWAAVTTLLLSVVGAFLSFASSDPRPQVRTPMTWRTRVAHARSELRVNAVLGLGVVSVLMAAYGILLWKTDEEFSSTLVAAEVPIVFTVAFLTLCLFDLASRPRQVIVDEPPEALVEPEPGAVLDASRDGGLVTSLGYFAVGGLAFAVLGWSDLGVSAELAGTWIVWGVVCGLWNGLDAWLYYHWALRRLRRQGLVPKRWEQFLSWCTLPERGWLRVGGTYEFRHRELLEYLAVEGSVVPSVERARFLYRKAAALQRRNDVDGACHVYEIAVTADPSNANLLGDYAHLLFREGRELERAGELFEQALAARPDHANNLGHYARFQWLVRADPRKAAELFARSIRNDDKDPGHLGSFAHLSWRELDDFDRAQALYLQALEIAPDLVANLWGYAELLRARGDVQGAAGHLERAVSIESSATVLTMYANVLDEIGEDDARVRALHAQAVRTSPQEAFSLEAYAFFLQRRGQDPELVRSLAERTVAAVAEVPANDRANALANAACLILELGDEARALELVERAQDIEDAPKPMQAELWFYVLVATGSDRHAEARRALLRLLVEDGVVSPGWDLSRLLRRATESQHPNVALLEQIAEVLSGAAPAATLAPWLGEGDGLSSLKTR